MNLHRNNLLHSRPSSMDDFSDLQTPVFKRQKIEAPPFKDGNKEQVIYMPTDSLAFSVAETEPTMFHQSSTSTCKGQ